MSKAYERLEQQVGEEKAELMIHYMDEILRMNEHINLTAVRDPEEFIVKHLLDSLGCVGSPEWEKADTIADVGTGAGFPGVPLAVMAPEKKISLIDSLQKRLRVIDDITRSLDIQNTTTFHLRAEEAGQGELRESFDFAVSRAVAAMNILCEYCLPFVKVGGTFCAMKGAKGAEELDCAGKAITTLGGETQKTETLILPDGGERVLINVKKISHTATKYPRPSAQISKKPLV